MEIGREVDDKGAEGRVAMERPEWRRFEEAFAIWQTDTQKWNKRKIHE